MRARSADAASTRAPDPEAWQERQVFCIDDQAQPIAGAAVMLAGRTSAWATLRAIPALR
jgi:hypothetical protein